MLLPAHAYQAHPSDIFFAYLSPFLPVDNENPKSKTMVDAAETSVTLSHRNLQRLIAQCTESRDQHRSQVVQGSGSTSGGSNPFFVLKIKLK